MLATCDAADGLTDGVLGDPTDVHDRSDRRSPARPGTNADGCLSREEIAAVETITKGPILNGKPYHVGFP